jgi:hypothetical protein
MKFEDYLHLYGIDCPIMTPDGEGHVLGIHPRAVKVHISRMAHGQVMKGMKRTGDGELHYTYLFKDGGLQLILRPLSDMTPEEEEEWLSGREETRKAFQGKFVDNDYATHCGFCDGGSALYLLSRGFDLFGLIDAGLALDKTKHMQRP